jgi:predicted small integral membrane protein
MARASRMECVTQLEASRLHGIPTFRILGTVAGYVLGGVLVLAAYAKAIHPHGFAAQLRDFPVFAAIAYPGALFIIAFESALGVALLSGSRHPYVLVVTNATFLLFVGMVASELVRPDGTSTCGCFGHLLERTPRQAFFEDVGFAALSGLAWLGRTARSDVLRWWPSAVGVAGSVALAVCAPLLPLDDQATALAPGVTVAATQLDRVLPELRTGRHLVLLLDRADAATRERIAHLNDRLKLPHGATTVWGVADDDPELAAEFLWSAGPAFDVRGAPPRMLRRLYRTLPRSALIDGGRVVQTWSGFPPNVTLDALARGELP